MVIWQVTILGIVCILFLVFAFLRTSRRSIFKGFLWADILIIAAFLTFSTDFLFNLLVNVYNAASGFILTRLRSQGLAVNPDTAVWQPKLPNTATNHGTAVTELIMFFVIAAMSYAIVTGKPRGKPGDKPPRRNILSGIIGVLSVGFLLEVVLSRLLSIVNGSLDIPLLQNSNFVIPSLTQSEIPFSGADIRVVAKSQDLPLLGWNLWVPIIIAIMQLFYILYITFAKPPTVTRVQLRLGLIFFLAVSTIIIAIFAWQLNLVK